MTTATNVPPARTPLIDRSDERRAIGDLLRRPDVRLVTLTGMGGIGKTRLASAVAAELAESFVDGVWFVDLTTAHEPELVGTVIAQVLGLRDQPGQAREAALVAGVGQRSILLLLDSCEVVIDAMGLIGRLLDGCRNLRVLATSRRPLGLYGEYDVPLDPLAVPDLRRLGERPLDDLLPLLGHSPAVALFVERARAANGAFTLNATNARAVVDLCQDLDGLPLAIELAAGRTRALSPMALRDRLDRRLEILTGGPRDRPTRHHTMRECLAWSYELLLPMER